MNKFSIKQSVTVDIPESFRRDIQELCDIVERESSIDVTDVLSLILEANPDEKQWNNWDNSIVINFVEDNVLGGR